ncbi:hypothetical protein HanXRQr2_Chr16g0741271 [Helianthus annuus]|uniref:Uncharacterized protein n=1 Tax=Helianthus annuus TaxID=4232 RepID=A0A9K3DRI6_HELAN|nr:hypothetical protein HanXRQr2_Chr16g0741271 [Helianthus annuus]
MTFQKPNKSIGCFKKLSQTWLATCCIKPLVGRYATSGRLCNRGALYNLSVYWGYTCMGFI